MATQQARYEELLQINHATIEAIRQAQREANANRREANQHPGPQSLIPHSNNVLSINAPIREL